MVESRDKGLVTVAYKAHRFKDLSTQDFLLEILYKVRNKAACNELQEV